MKTKAKIVIFSFLFILILPLYSLAQPGDDITVTVTIRNLVAALVVAPEDKTADPAQTVSYNFTVQNLSNVPDTYDLSADSSQRWRPVITGGNSVGPLAPSEIAQVTIEQALPDRESAGTEDTLTLIATSQIDSVLSGSDSVLTTVNQIAALTISAFPKRGRVRPGETIFLRATVINEGNGNDTFQLAATSLLGWQVGYPEGNTIGPIAPNSRERILLTVTVPANAVKGQTDTVAITAASQFDPAVSGSDSSILIVR